MLKLRYTARTSIPVEVEGLTPSAIRGRPLAEIERFEVYHGNRTLPLAELFAVAGAADDGRMELEGDLGGVHWIGAHMVEGEIHVVGDAGRHVGSEMKGGAIHVHGHAGDWAGAEMQGGLLHVHGRAGHLVGSAYRGSRHGMTGGTILVDGSAGNEIGHTLRRGTIAIGGSCGDFPGFNMIAGTVLAFGPCGIRPAAGMRRGTVALLGPSPPVLLPTFVKGCLYDSPLLPLMFHFLQAHGFAVADEYKQATYRLYHGDNVTIGRGEVLLRDTAAG